MIRTDRDFVRRRRARSSIEAPPELRQRWEALVAQAKDLTGTDEVDPVLILGDAVQLGNELDPMPPAIRDKDPAARIGEEGDGKTRYYVLTFPLIPGDETMRADDIKLKYSMLYALSYLNGGIRLDELNSLGLTHAWDIIIKWVDDTRAGG
ncbi:MAG: hypothetical protein ABS76_26590 [Pelagibacterium sp. SCN 64-44]|nr:MAG: hypothetical protein ABS76_26590 [Pelagibacterium sp. SCN 64-44]